MKRLGFALGGGLAGAFVAAVIGFGLPSVVPISQAEGAYAMGVAFFWIPLGAVVGGITAFIVSGRRRP